MEQLTIVYAWLQRTEVVLTAHPTQVNRRTLQHKHCRIAALLAQNDRHIISCPLVAPLLGCTAAECLMILRPRIGQH